MTVVLLAVSITIGTFTVWKFSQWNNAAKNIIDVEKRIQVENQSIATLAQIVGGIFLFLSLYFTWQSVRESQESRLTDRFIKAIELLGDTSSVSKRVGGIYALERIAWDSEKDHWTVMEILMAFLREKVSRETYQKRSEESPNRTLEDVHAAIRTIARRRLTYKRGEQHSLLLEDLNLEGADFYEANLSGARLNRTILKNASLRKSRLDDARLRGANLQGATLSRAFLCGADLTGANLDEANLEETDLTNCVGLTQKQLAKAIINHETILPSYLPKSLAHPRENSRT